MKISRRKNSSIKNLVYVITASFMIAFAWNYYHISHKQILRFWVLTGLMFVLSFGGFYLFKFLYKKLSQKFINLEFWKGEFYGFLNELFFVGSLFFSVFFFQNELLSLAIFFTNFIILFTVIQKHLSKHPTAFMWQTVNRTVFIFIGFLFLLNSLLQFLSYQPVSYTHLRAHET